MASDSNLKVYKNEDALPLGFLVNDTIRQWDTTTGTPIDVQDSFVALATGHEPIYTLDRYLDLESGAENPIMIPEGKQVYVYLANRVKELRLKTPEYSKTYSTYTDHLYVINACDDMYEAKLTATLSRTRPRRRSSTPARTPWRRKFGMSLRRTLWKMSRPGAAG